MEVPERKRVVLPRNHLRLGRCEAKNCEHHVRMVLAEIQLSSGRIVRLCESCLDKEAKRIKRYRQVLKQEPKSDIMEIEKQ